MRRAGALAAAVAVAVVSALTAREVVVGREELAAADQAVEGADWPDAIAHARAAAQALAPGSPFPEQGMLRLGAIGRGAEARGDDATALLAYGAMRAAALATRAPGADNAAWRSRAEEGLARVASYRSEPSARRVPTEAMLAALRADEPPALLRLAVLAAGFAGMLTGLAALLRPPAGTLRTRAAQAVILAGFVAYAAALALD
jgi:hypothetical protein